MPLTLYTHPMSRGRIARWMLEELGQPYETVVLDYGTTMRAPAFLAINPMGKVPTIVHDGTVVSETAAICTHLADAFPTAGLMPANRGDFFRWMFWGAGPLEQAVVNRALGVTVPDEKRGMVGYRDLESMVDMLATRLETAPYLCGDSFSAADVYLGSQIGWGLQFGTIPARPVLSDYWAKISARPAAMRAKAMDDALAAAKNG